MEGQCGSQVVKAFTHRVKDPGSIPHISKMCEARFWCPMLCYCWNIAQSGVKLTHSLTLLYQVDCCVLCGKNN